MFNSYSPKNLTSKITISNLVIVDFLYEEKNLTGLDPSSTWIHKAYEGISCVNELIHT